MISSKSVFGVSRLIHKYIGLAGFFLFAYFILMGLSGILLNHPHAIGDFSVPSSLLSKKMQIKNWNNYSVRAAQCSSLEPGTVYFGGKLGVWRSRGYGKEVESLGKGFPSSVFRRSVFSLLLVEKGRHGRLFAGTSAGLYYMDLKNEIWTKVENDDFSCGRIRSIVMNPDKVFVFTNSKCYASPLDADIPDFTVHRLGPPPNIDANSRISAFRFFIKLHDGSILGPLGRIVMDLAGLALIFLTVSAVYIWYIPWIRRHSHGKKKKARFFKFFYKYHLKVGIYSSAFIFIVTITGMLMWPPFFSLFENSTLPGYLYYANWSDNPWRKKIRRVVYVPQGNRFIISTSNGFFIGSAGGGSFKQMYPIINVRYPGVLKMLEKDKVLLGSRSSGLYTWNLKDNTMLPFTLKDKKALSRGIGEVALNQGGPEFYVHHKKGIIPVNKRYGDRIPMPPEILSEGRVSLWHFLLYFHNGRLFKDFLSSYWYIVQFGGLLLLLTTLSGTYDWLYRRGFFRRKKESGA